jgi:hypothetical protein
MLFDLILIAVALLPLVAVSGPELASHAIDHNSRR